MVSTASGVNNQCWYNYSYMLLPLQFQLYTESYTIAIYSYHACMAIAIWEDFGGVKFW